MATSLTYPTLVTNIQNYLERGATPADQTVMDQIPYFINGAERKIMQALKLQGTNETLVDPAGFPAGQSVIAKPDRWRQTVSINYGTGTNNNSRQIIYPRSYEYCRAYWPDDSVLGQPEFYADYNYGYWLIVPTPDLTYPLELQCYMQPPYLDENNQENFFSTYTPNILLYGALLEAAPFLKNDDRIATWKNLWDFEAQTLGLQDLQKILDRASERKNV